ncbi:MAG: hypothetical protein ABW219_09675 [Ilumatobacteraceae bacterium]
MTRTIQKPVGCVDQTSCGTRPAVRRAFLEHAADLYELALTDGELDALAQLDDRPAIIGAFPQLSDAEVGEALWALGRFT